MIKFKVSALFVMIVFVWSAHAQDIRINEVMASNVQTILDEDGDTPDWIELYNAGTEDIDLEGYTLTDDASNPTPWTFPAFILSADQHLLLFASDKDRREAPLRWETVIDLADEWKYLVPETEPDAAWRQLGFDDTSWTTGKTSIGYGDDDDSTVVESVLSIFLRKTFDVSDADQISEIILHMDYDDGFIAYLNGIEIARSGLSEDVPPFDAVATSHESVMYTGGQPEAYSLSEIESLLEEGENVLCVQVHNTNSNSSDMTIIPILSIGSSANRGGDFSEFIQLSQASFHTDFKISSDGDTLMLFDADQQMVDSIYTGSLTADVSIGRNVDESEGLFYFDEPTPGEANSVNAFDALSGEVEFSISGGIYSTSFEVVMTTVDAEGEIYFTTDGSKPTIASSLYTEAVLISSSTNLQARVIHEDHIPGKLQTASYLLGISHDLPVVSLTVDPYEFFDPVDGMYMKGPNAEANDPYFGANFWEDWERGAHVEMYEADGTLAFSANAGAKIFGAYSRGNDQKSLSLFFRKAYGDGPIKYQLFEEKELDEFSSIVLRNSGNDWNNTMMRDGLMTSLFHESVDRQAYRPAVLYINGEYFGIQNIREKINEHFIANNNAVDSEDVEIVETNTVPVHGNEENYRDLVAFVESNNLSNSDNYEYVQTQMDVMNFIYYMTGNIFINNTDWPGNNIKFWRENSEVGKWRWIAFDTDFGFGIWEPNDYVNNTLSFAMESNGPDWPNPPWSTLLLRRLMDNEDFKNLFINTYVDQLNSAWKTEVIQENISSKSEAIENEIQDHLNRWYGNYGRWLQQIDAYHNYAQNRPAYARQHIVNHFGLSGTFDLIVKVSGASHGKVIVNTLAPNEYPWTANYMDNIPVKIKAIAKPGYEFAGWIGVTSAADEAVIMSSEDIEVRAVFEKAGNGNGHIVINEINYNSGEETQIDDWVELHNAGSTTLDISGWVLKDDDDAHAFVFPESTQIAGDDFLIVCRDIQNFSDHYSSVENVVGDMDFGLSSGGDCVRLFDPNGALIAKVCYESTSPWPELANGTGSTLALKNPNFDANEPDSWYALGNGGNPGQPNANTVTEIQQLPSPYELTLYPNPFTESTRIRYYVNYPGAVDIRVYNLQGKEVDVIANSFHSIGSHEMDWRPSLNVKNGLYLVKINGLEGVNILRVIFNE